MQCQPYETLMVRGARRWKEAADGLGVDPTVLQQVYFDHWWRTMQGDDFRYYMTHEDGDQKFRTQVKAQCAELNLTAEAIAAQAKRQAEIWEEGNDCDEKSHRLKCIIEVGDEWMCDETKTYCFSGVQYLTAGKRYAILSLTDKHPTGPEFSLTTATDLPGEINYISELSCMSIWRDGVEIWNWNLAYLAYWLEHNPDHPQRQEMIDHCTERAKKTSIGERE